MNVASLAIGRAYGKLNLHLDVLARRSDGFHEISSLVCATDLFDEVTVHPAEDGQFEIATNDPTLPTDDANLVIQAARQLANAYGVSRGARFELHKAIPTGGGMGGGSSDAATALTLLNQFWNLRLPEEQLAEIGARIGSDVPLFFALPSARIAGRGEKVHAVPLRWAGWAVLLFGPEPVSTARVYREWRPTDSAPDPNGNPDATIDMLLRAANASQIMQHSRNALQPAVFRLAPAMARLADQATESTNRRFRITGAGSTLYFLFDTPEDARHHATILQHQGQKTAVVRAGRFMMDNL
jgi:4-diphosphocytidyl-2-C-methyl-D-erythritol kinase